jgi:hypothetical protein
MSEHTPRGQDPDKTTGQDRAEEVRPEHAGPQSEGKPSDPPEATQLPAEPDESELPDKPAIEDMPSEEGIAPPTDQEEHEALADDEPMDPSEADADDTVDNAEQEQPRHSDLPEGATADDYNDDAVEADDSEEETPSRGQG